MPLSEHEQRLLEQIERALYAEDPKFASTVRGGKLRRPSRRRRVQGIALFVLGVVMLVLGRRLQLLRRWGSDRQRRGLPRDVRRRDPRDHVLRRPQEGEAAAARGDGSAPAGDREGTQPLHHADGGALPPPLRAGVALRSSRSDAPPTHRGRRRVVVVGVRPRRSDRPQTAGATSTPPAGPPRRQVRSPHRRSRLIHRRSPAEARRPTARSWIAAGSASVLSRAHAVVRGACRCESPRQGPAQRAGARAGVRHGARSGRGTPPRPTAGPTSPHRPARSVPTAAPRAPHGAPLSLRAGPQAPARPETACRAPGTPRSVRSSPRVPHLPPPPLTSANSSDRGITRPHRAVWCGGLWGMVVSSGANGPHRGGGAVFLGTHTPRLDDKGRLTLPAQVPGRARRGADDHEGSGPLPLRVPP